METEEYVLPVSHETFPVPGYFDDCNLWEKIYKFRPP